MGIFDRKIDDAVTPGTNATLRRLENITAAFARKAADNLTTWGDQDYQTLALAIAEEAGEVAQAVLKWRHEDGPEGLIADEADDLGALCVQVVLHWQDHAKPGGAT